MTRDSLPTQCKSCIYLDCDCIYINGDCDYSCVWVPEFIKNKLSDCPYYVKSAPIYKFSKMKRSEILQILLDDILCDIEFCTSPTQIVDTINEDFVKFIEYAKKNDD